MKVGSAEWDEQSLALNALRLEQTGYEFADYEIQFLNGTGGFMDQAIYALEFHEEKFQFAETQAVSCNICGGLFRDNLALMRRHRLQCGWVQ
ncbi:hypothetical protein JRC04_04725 [Mycolicibacterium sp. S2-37]|uniref:hypothetical protein n=1 Tax=Mycolicibacterium sp. S2-37 TaxID=2810297 RepID=UPI001A93D35E|nr:hypothetical protein [Mycolicibacterium sp. S2-37]MBO0676763.1 hypothetical protein [Mycolicibacterium sp. S2-37]